MTYAQFDEKDRRAMLAYLASSGFSEIDEWAREHGYEYSEYASMWVDWQGNQVDVWLELFHFMEGAGELPHTKKQEVKPVDAELELLLMEEELIQVQNKLRELEEKQEDLADKIARLSDAIKTAKEFGVTIYGGK